MADAWTSQTISDPEWSEASRNEALAHIQVANLTCGKCGQRNALVPVEKVEFDRVDWTEHDKRFEVKQLRCLACASVEMVRDDLTERLKNDTQAAQRKFAGLRFIALEIPRPESEVTHGRAQGERPNLG